VSSAYTESDFIRDYLLAATASSIGSAGGSSLSPDQIVVDRSARDTLGNAIFVADALRERNIQNVIVDTSTYHAVRCTLTLRGALSARGLDATVVTIGAGNHGFKEGKALSARLELEQKASHRDAARARGLFTLCDF
jgi:hypothetical protein